MVDGLFSRDALLSGQWDVDRQARRAVGAIEARVLYMRGETRRALTAYLTGDFEQYSRGIDSDYLGSLRARAREAWRPLAADFERFVDQWRALVPDDPDRRDAVRRIAVLQFSLNERESPETLRALGAAAVPDGLPAESPAERLEAGSPPSSVADGRPDVVLDAERAVSWRVLEGGDVLFRPGDPGDALYIVINGRVRLAREDGADAPVLAEAGRGEVLGETEVLTGDPRSLRAFAVRDTELLMIPQPVLLEMARRDPNVMLRINHELVARVRTRSSAAWPTDALPARAPLATIALVPLGDVDLASFARELEAELAVLGETVLISHQRIHHQIATDGRGLDIDGPELLGWLHEYESAHRYVVYQADATQPAWTERCIRQADRVVLVTGADASPRRYPIEEWIADRAVPPTQDLVLLYPGDAQRADGAGAWLEGRPVQQHALLRRGDADQMGRLARRLTGNGIGLALGGGGSRGYAHLGVLRALERRGVPVDVIGGSSMGALLGAGMVQGRDSGTLTQRALVIAASRRQLIDLTLPFAAAATGGKITRLLQDECGDVRIEDLWHPYFCMATNLTRAEAQVIDRGLLWEAVRASISIPGLWPPFLQHGRDLLVDGGVMNGLPVDVMRQRPDIGTVIGVNVTPPRPVAQDYEFGPAISGWRVGLDRLRGRAARLRPPSIIETLVRTTEVHAASQRSVEFYQEQSDLLISPVVAGIGTTDFARCASLVEAGYDAAHAPLDDWLRTAAPAWLRQRCDAPEASARHEGAAALMRGGRSDG